MIGKLKGRVEELSEDAVIIDVGGVGYHVFASARTIAALAPGEAATLIIETHVREDHIHLFGFPDTVERDWFRLLCTVQGVGAKIALTILGAYGPGQMVHSILARDSASFRAISGIGPKLAERIVTELKDKVSKLPAGSPAPVVITGGKGKKGKAVLVPAENITEDAISALVNLGYSRSDAYGAAVRAGQKMEGKASIDQLIRLSLKELARASGT